MTKVEVISINISTGSKRKFIEEIGKRAVEKRSNYVCVANVHMLVEAHNDSSFASVVNNADLITPDGMPLTWAIKALHKIKQERVAGMDLLPLLLTKASELNLSVFFYGGTDEMLEKTKVYLNKEFPTVRLAGVYSPPFRPLTAQEEHETVQLINESGAGLVFVVLGCPKQERWMAAMRGRVNAVMIGIGGALPVLIGLQRRAPKWMQNLGLEWVFRLV